MSKYKKIEPGNSVTGIYPQTQLVYDMEDAFKVCINEIKLTVIADIGKDYSLYNIPYKYYVDKQDNIIIEKSEIFSKNLALRVKEYISKAYPSNFLFPIKKGIWAKTKGIFEGKPEDFKGHILGWKIQIDALKIEPGQDLEELKRLLYNIEIGF